MFGAIIRSFSSSSFTNLCGQTFRLSSTIIDHQSRMDVLLKRKTTSEKQLLELAVATQEEWCAISGFPFSSLERRFDRVASSSKPFGFGDDWIGKVQKDIYRTIFKNLRFNENKKEERKLKYEWSANDDHTSVFKLCCETSNILLNSSGRAAAVYFDARLDTTNIHLLELIAAAKQAVSCTAPNKIHILLFIDHIHLLQEDNADIQSTIKMVLDDPCASVFITKNETDTDDFYGSLEFVLLNTALSSSFVVD